MYSGYVIITCADQNYLNYNEDHYENRGNLRTLYHSAFSNITRSENAPILNVQFIKDMANDLNSFDMLLNVWSIIMNM